MTIPRLNVTTALTVTDGTDVAGFIAEHDGSFFAYGADHGIQQLSQTD